MSHKKYTPEILKQYHFWKMNCMGAQAFCDMKGLNRANLSAQYSKWVKRTGALKV
jgi:hypothetical protein